MREMTQSFQVEGPQNREISLFIGNKIGRFFRERFQAEKQSATSTIMYYINKTCRINRTSVVHIEIHLTYLAQDKHFV